MTHKIALVVLVTISPISELRGGIPLGISLGLDPWLTFFIATIANAILFFPILLVLRLGCDRILSRLQIFKRYLDSLRRKGEPRVDRYGSLALALFVAIPLPATGVYTATILSWLLGMHWRKAFPAIAVGVIIAGIIVLLITLGAVAGMRFLILA